MDMLRSSDASSTLHTNINKKLLDGMQLDCLGVLLSRQRRVPEGFWYPALLLVLLFAEAKITSDLRPVRPPAQTTCCKHPQSTWSVLSSH